LNPNPKPLQSDTALYLAQGAEAGNVIEGKEKVKLEIAK
jgi:hypothetical protein